MKNSIILQDMTSEELSEIITKTIKSELSDLKNLSNQSEEERLLTREEVCNLLKVNPATIHNWQKEGKIKVYGIGGRRYFKKSEIIELLIPLNK